MLRGQPDARGRGLLAIITGKSNPLNCPEGCRQEVQGMLDLTAPRRLSRSGSENTWVGLLGGVPGSTTGTCILRATGLGGAGIRTHTRGKIPEVKCMQDEPVLQKWGIEVQPARAGSWC